MGSGTDIAKETSKMVILDDNFKSIVSGILEGRVAYANIRKIIYFLLSCGLAEVLFFTLSIFCNMPIPLVAIQLLWLNVVTDGIQDIALSFEKAEKDIMKEPPRDPKENLFDKTLVEEILLSGLSIGLLVFCLWWYLLKIKTVELLLARSYIMAFMIIIQNIHTLNCRSEKLSISDISWTNNPIFMIGIIGSLLLGLAVIEVPLLSSFLKTTHIPYQDFCGLFGLGLIILLIMECYKKIKYHTK
jgi:magnesium-transporting ATPase (P-type)